MHSASKEVHVNLYLCHPTMNQQQQNHHLRRDSSLCHCGGGGQGVKYILLAPNFAQIMLSRNGKIIKIKIITRQYLNKDLNIIIIASLV